MLVAKVQKELLKMSQRFDNLSNENFDRIKSQIGNWKTDEILKACLDYNLNLKLNLELSQKKIDSMLNKNKRAIEKSGQSIKNYLMFK